MAIITFKRIRIAILLFMLAAVAIATWRQNTAIANWVAPLDLTLYPINGDGSPATKKYIASLTVGRFDDITRFLNEEARAYGIYTRPLVKLSLGPEETSIPPYPPRHGNVLAIIFWSLHLRWWLHENVSSFGLEPRHIRIFVIYHRAQGKKPLRHSFGLHKGLVGVVHAFALADQDGENNMVITHELMHTLGATDKYNADGQPRFPDGYGDPEQKPLYPQGYAEIMAGRIALSAGRSVIPTSLDQCLIGPETAQEIHWREKKS
jgi:hypothetical protein